MVKIKEIITCLTTLILEGTVNKSKKAISAMFANGVKCGFINNELSYISIVKDKSFAINVCILNYFGLGSSSKSY